MSADRSTSHPPGVVSSSPTASSPEVPALAEVAKHLARSDVAGAIRAAFPLVMIDVQRVYSLSFPLHWTARDVLAHGLRSDMGRLPDLLFLLYSLYEPVRYGQERDWVDGDVRDIVRRIYTETGLRVRARLSDETPHLMSRPTFSVTPPAAETGGPGW